jgi:hypothetical protein
MAVTTNTTTTANFNALTVREIDFISRFEGDWQALVEIMGIMRPIRKQPGTKLASVKASLVDGLKGGTVAEGDEVPLTQVQVTPVAYQDIELKKYRTRVTAESVEKYGAKIAVQRTDDAFLNELTGVVLDDFYSALGSGTLTASYNNFQMALSMAVTNVKDYFKKLHLGYGNIVAFVNTLDVGEYLGTANISTQNRNGIEYLKDFLGANTVIVSSEVPKGKIYATSADNIALYYIDPSDGDFAELGLNYTTGNAPTRLIGIHKEGVYGRVSGDTHALMGMTLFSEYIDGIANISISAGA